MNVTNHLISYNPVFGPFSFRLQMHRTRVRLEEVRGPPLVRTLYCSLCVYFTVCFSSQVLT